MVKPSSDLPLHDSVAPHVGVRVGDALHDAVPVLLRGQEASLVLEERLSERASVDLVLRWDDGRVTELAARVRAVDGGGRVAHVDVQGVAGDWRPFLEYLGGATC